MAPLVALRASQGHQAALVSIDDVYDEFSFGVRSPQALKDFLSHARTTWAVAPRYVVLAGDATFDPRDYAALGFGDFVPTRLVDMSQIELETASDDWFVDANADGLPELAIGRLPVRTPDPGRDRRRKDHQLRRRAWRTMGEGHRTRHRHRRPHGALPRLERGCRNAGAVRAIR